MKITKKLVIIILLITYSLFFAELFVRIFSPEKIMPRYVTATEHGIRGNIINSSYWHTTPDTRVQMRINSKGIRSDKEYSYSKGEGQCRIVIFGDSFFMGYEVSLEDSFAYLLEKNLNKLGYPCEVINLAVSGFGTAEMLIALQKEGQRYQPDLVIFQWHESDLDENIRSALYRLKNGKLEKAKNQYLPGIKTRDWLMQFGLYRIIIEHSQLYSALREYAATNIKKLLASQSMNTNTDKEDSSVSLDSPQIKQPEAYPYKVRLSLELLEEVKKLTRIIGAKFLLVDVPVKWKNRDMYSSLDDMPDDMTKNFNMVTPIQSFFKFTDGQQLLYFENGAGHWNEAGNRIVTDLTVRKILDMGWLNEFKK